MWLAGFKFVWDLTTSELGLDAEAEIYRSMAFVFVFNVFNTIVGLPFSVYYTFVLEQKHGFNNQTVGFYVKDKIKKFVVGQAIMLPLVAVVVKIVASGGDFFVFYLWLFVFAFTLFMLVVYPEFIAPLFDKYTPLPDGDLRERIEALAASINFPLYKLFVVEGSKRSSHSNAYFYGFFKFKRIVLFDTLLEEDERKKLDLDKKEEEEDDNGDKKRKKKKMGCNTDEILAVLGHELGHWKLNHVLKNIIISEVHILLMFSFFGYLYKNAILYEAFGFDEGEKPILLGLMIVLQFIAAPYNAVLDFAMTCLSRRFEFQADEFAAKELKRAERLKDALVKLNNDNLSFPVFDWMFSAFHHSHPPLLERIRAIDDVKAA